MPIDYKLGRECFLYIDFRLVPTAQDVSVREFVDEVDTTAFRSSVQSSVAIHRTLEVTVVIPDIAVARAIVAQRTVQRGMFRIANRYRLRLLGGLFDIDDRFTLSDVQGDEPIDGIILPRLTFRQWEYAR